MELSMQSKSTRGIQQDDVWGAADALIAEGLRPTIERVRLKIGRGSPNTVSPMLETWFATLGQRLGVTQIQSGAGALPPLVLKAAAEMWNTAQLSAQEDASKAFTAARDALDGEQASLEARETDLRRQEQVLNERHIALNEALATARSQIADLSGRLNGSKAALAQRDRRINELQSQLADLEKLRDAERHQKDEEGKTHLDERRRLEERSAANERRLLIELDRERQEIKRSKTAFSEVEKIAENLRRGLEMANQRLEDRLQESQVELRTARQALASANEHTAELRALFEMQSTTNAVAQKQLNLRTVNPQRKKAAMALTRRRRI